MKTLVQVNITPKKGMIVEALKGRYKHHIIEFGSRALYFVNGKAVYGKFVHCINEKGSSSWVEYNHFVNNYGYVAMSNFRFSDLFQKSDITLEKENEIKMLIKKLEEAVQ